MKEKMKEKIIRIDDYSELEELHQKILQLINYYNITGYNAIGVLEHIKQEIFLGEEGG